MSRRAVEQSIELVQRMGLRWVLWRTGYAFRRKSGLLRRRFPTVPWDAVSLAELLRPGVPAEPNAYHAFRCAHLPVFLFAPGALPRRETLSRVAGEAGAARTIQIADDYSNGKFLYYSRHVRDLGRPVNWLLNPFTGGQHESETHWCDYPTFSAALGDIKDVWEPARFACAFWLVRAYALTGDEKYPAAFWELFESWCKQNPPNRGPNWKCGQEISLRLFAWSFALYGFWGSPATTVQRVAEMVKAVALQAERVHGNIDFALSQKNNHGVSEAVGLITVGMLFPELRGAARWLRRGRSLFEGEIRRQIAIDGSYVQQSMNYHRVVLHDCLWARCLVEAAGEPFAADVTDLIDRAGEFLFQIMDESGGVPNYGSNDGALVLPLSSCDYPDYRPTVQAAKYLATKSRVLSDGPWDELLIWLSGEDSVARPPQPAHASGQRLDAGGYFTLRDGNAWCMIRCHTYRDRPAHVDMLHVDLWHRGVNILGDSGSYKYYCPESTGMDKFFKDIRAHNTIEIGGRGPLELFSRFLWLPWPGGRCLEHGRDHFLGEHDAYDREPWYVLHRRGVRVTGGGDWLIRDDLDGEGRHAIVLRWHLADLDWKLDTAARTAAAELPKGSVRLVFDVPVEARIELHRGLDEGDRVAGWSSLYYGEKTARPTLEVRVDANLPLTLVTRVEFQTENG
ncbi:MAG: hypothetical protein DCC65_03160 [Planctomycetota bacterium]|nr:MAG: hypothetical protein DCC65_03160 [Planctomycetota bacterium]